MPGAPDAAALTIDNAIQAVDEAGNRVLVNDDLTTETSDTTLLEVLSCKCGMPAATFVGLVLLAGLTGLCGARVSRRRR